MGACSSAARSSTRSSCARRLRRRRAAPRAPARPAASCPAAAPSSWQVFGLPLRRADEITDDDILALIRERSNGTVAPLATPLATPAATPVPATPTEGTPLPMPKGSAARGPSMLSALKAAQPPDEGV